MKKVSILTKGFSTPNGAAFLFPLIKHKKALKDYGIYIQFFTDKNKITDGEILIVDSKYFRAQWSRNTESIIEMFINFRKIFNKILYADISDSSGWPHARILPYVDAYIKNQLLVDRTRYLKPMYGHRVYTDYYHYHFQVNDKDENQSEIIQDPALLSKLKLGWNSGLADYSLYGPYRMMLYDKLPLPTFLSFPRRFYSVARHRPQDVSCRMGISYARDTVAWQRREISSRLKKYLSSEKLSRRKYYQELCRSKIVISPFGLGEITLKDFEVFLAGGLLLKPDMSHMQTWPNWYRDKETIITYRWDLNDLEKVVNEVKNNYSHYSSIAQEGQKNYQDYLIGKKAEELFCNHFLETIEDI